MVVHTGDIVLHTIGWEALAKTFISKEYNSKTWVNVVIYTDIFREEFYYA